MKSLQQQKGFTLVELAIVLTIIGLLIGGVLKGQALMTNARVTATINQVKAIDSAATTFRDAYNFLPGDLPSADKRIANCAKCALTGTSTDGDGIIGKVAWDITTPNESVKYTAGSGTLENEALLFWAELNAAQNLSGLTSTGQNDVAAGKAAFGVDTPAAKIGGGFIVGHANGNTGQALKSAIVPGASRTYLSGTVLGIVVNPGKAVAVTAGDGSVDPIVARQIDLKMDDGLSLAGVVQGGGLNDTAANGGCMDKAAAPYEYNAANAKSCSLFIEIQG